DAGAQVAADTAGVGGEEGFRVAGGDDAPDVGDGGHDSGHLVRGADEPQFEVDHHAALREPIRESTGRMRVFPAVAVRAAMRVAVRAAVAACAARVAGAL